MNSRERVVADRRALVQQARDLMRANLHNPDLSLNDIAAQLFISRRHLQRAFYEADSEGYRNELYRMRAQAGAALIKRDPNRPIEDIARLVGYQDPSQFAKSFRRQFETTPRAWRARCRARSVNGALVAG
jgi:AraC-like DNA-binding protein